MPAPPVQKMKWMNLKNMAAEAGNPDLADKTFNEERYAAAAEASKPFIDFQCLPHKLKILYRNEANCQIEYWRMDLEVLFSSQPFSNSADSFTWVTPNDVHKEVNLPEGKNERRTQ